MVEFPEWPSHICVGCVTSLHNIHQFKTNVKANQDHLPKLYGQVEVKCKQLKQDPLLSRCEVDEQIERIRDTSKIECNPDKDEGKPEGQPQTRPRLGRNSKNCRKAMPIHRNSKLQHLLDEEKRSHYIKYRELQASKREERQKLEDQMKTMNLLFCKLCRNSGTNYDKYWDSFAALASHFKQAHGQEAFLYCCGKEHKKTAKAAFDHVRWHLDENSFKCTKCDKVFRSRFLLRSHTRQIHPAEQYLKCPKCTRVCLAQATLDRHLLVHDDDKPRPCAQCDKVYKSLHGLNRHIRRAHGNERSTRAICTICGLECKSNGHYEKHMQRHDPDRKKEACDVCGLLVFAVEAHKKRVHLNEPCSCPTCGKQFQNQACLRRHTYTGHTVKRFPCTICKKVFDMKNKLMDHIRNHTGAATLKCNFCEDHFTTFRLKYAHYKKHHNDEYLKYKKQKHVNIDRVSNKEEAMDEEGFSATT